METKFTGWGMAFNEATEWAFTIRSTRPAEVRIGNCKL